MTGSLAGRIAVFAGPSLPSCDRPADPIFAWYPPARAGDGYLIAGEGPKAVVLIDGFFDETPAIRHKELLSLMTTGIALIGGASMGALRAAELWTYGMTGIGRIFCAYASGRLVADDEVAILHAPADLDWAPLTEAMVNVRATTLRAVRAACIDARFGRSLIEAAAGTFFKERTWPDLILHLAAHSGEAQALALEAWLPTGRVDLKRLDAKACLESALSLGAFAPTPAPPQTLFSAALAQQVAEGLRPRERSAARS